MSELDGTRGIVTGASGFIGRAFLRAIAPTTEVSALYWGDTTFPAWAESCRARIRPLRIDLREQKLAGQVPQADWALLCAARVHVAQSWEDPVREIRDASAVTVNSVRDLSVTQIVHVSSGAVYEGLQGRLSPSRTPSPRVPYGVAKFVAERLLDAFADAPWWNLRFFGAYGPGEPAYKLIRRAVEAFTSGETTFGVRGDGTNRLDPMYIDDAARALIRIVGHSAENRTVDLCQGERRSIDEFLHLAFAACRRSGGPDELVIEHEGVTHETVLGSPTSDEADAVFGLRRMNALEGLSAYADAVRRGLA